MAACEKCWSDAYLLSLITGREQYEEYEFLIHNGRECSEREQAGVYWDEELKVDSRLLLAPQKPSNDIFSHKPI